jgi:hypothetical protein
VQIGKQKPYCLDIGLILAIEGRKKVIAIIGAKVLGVVAGGPAN